MNYDNKNIIFLLHSYYHKLQLRMAKIEDEIQQRHFNTEIEKATLNIMYTSNWMRDETVPMFKKHGILQQHYNILRIVRGKKGEPTTPGQIIKVMLDKGRDLTRLVDKLVKINYLERRICPSNRRKVEIFITEEGLEVTEQIGEQISAWHRGSTHLSHDESIQLNDLLNKLRK